MLSATSSGFALPLSPIRVKDRSYVPHTATALGFIRRSSILCPADIESGRYTRRQRRFTMSNSLKALAKKKTLFALMLALTIFGAVYGFAATLNVGTNQLSAGNATVASWQATGTPTGTYAVVYDSTLPGYKVSTVTVNNLDAGCATKTVSVTLNDAGHDNLGTVTGADPEGGAPLAMTPGATPISAALVTGVAVAING